MKKLLSFCLLFICISINAQEICNNGIDDDGDGLIDLNDVTDCVCGAGTPSVVPSLIPNPSFEQNTCCPASYSELNCATGWQQATSATADYFNHCNYVASAITNAGLGTFPNGVACAGVIVCSDYKEYIGSCLTSPMLMGTSYKINFNIASLMTDGFLDDCPGGVNNNFGPLDITIYGKSNCPSFPVGSASDCPTIMDPSWTVLGTVNYTPTATWGLASISFTPSYNVNAIILGSPCNLPSTYPSVSSSCFPYFIFDNLTLNNAASFGLISISSTGHYCTDNIVLSANLSATVTSNATYQWYHNGIAIVGATGLTYSVAAGNTGLGDYQVMLNDGSLCALSSKSNVNTNPPVISVTSTTICPSALTVLTSTSSVINTYTWSTGETTNTISVSPSVTTTYTVSSIFGNCTAVSVSTVVVNSGLLNIIVDNPVICPSETAFISTTITPTNLATTTTYTWSTGSHANTISVTPSVTTTYTVYGASGTCTAIATSTVTVFGAGSLSISGNTVICAGQSSTLISNPSLFFNTWNDGGTGTLDNYFSSTVIATPFTTTTYTVSGSTGGGLSFCTSTAVITVSVLTSPNISIVPNSTNVCPGTLVNLSALGSTNGYTWSTGATNTSSISVTPTVSTTYSVTGSNGICPSTATAVINMISMPIVTINSPTICYGQSILIFANGAITYTWNNGTTNSSQNVTPTVTTIYSVIGSNGSGCSTLPITSTVTVANVIADFITSSNSLPVNSTLGLTNTSSNAINYSWLLCNNTVTTSINTSVTLKDTGICCIQLIAYHAPCSDTITKCVVVTPESMIHIPNVFTPNGDGQNEAFKINSTGLKSLHCVIFNRWGTKMYEWDGTTGFWDGKVKGSTAADGTYFYIVNYTDAQDNKKEEKGFLTLFKN